MHVNDDGCRDWRTIFDDGGKREKVDLYLWLGVGRKKEATVVDMTSYQARDRRPMYPNSNHCQAWIQRGPTTAATTPIFVTTTARDANTVNNKRRNDRDPPSDPYLTPHSFGEPCGKALDKELVAKAFYDDDEGDHCRYHCVQCHPGPCPPWDMEPVAKVTENQGQNGEFTTDPGLMGDFVLEEMYQTLMSMSVGRADSGSKIVGSAKAESVESGEKTSNMNIHLFLAMRFFVLAMKHPRMK
ncbi:hypothetical protein Tco_0839431 [Tanacetum coccineum]|uniref:Uncharacterized protein n=1 Tax=Tanacetum coccineum TaxID=301880 RepID=A0ABQ5ASH2_9ASTR